MRRRIAAGNWKMNGSIPALGELQKVAAGLGDSAPQVVICPPATLLFTAVAEMSDTPVRIGAQDCHGAASGAHTGDLSAAMVAETGATHVILGHSERRADHGETDAMVRAKAQAAYAAGLTAIVCLGETLEQRDAGETLEVIRTQLAGSLPDDIPADRTVVAYEPIWAIGTGKVPEVAQIAEVHDLLRAELTARFGAQAADTIPLLYGGSVKPDNAAEIFAVTNVDGALVGGASLKAADFLPIVTALADS